MNSKANAGQFLVANRFIARNYYLSNVTSESSLKQLMKLGWVRISADSVEPRILPTSKFNRYYAEVYAPQRRLEGLGSNRTVRHYLSVMLGEEWLPTIDEVMIDYPDNPKMVVKIVTDAWQDFMKNPDSYYYAWSKRLYQS